MILDLPTLIKALKHEEESEKKESQEKENVDLDQELEVCKIRTVFENIPKMSHFLQFFAILFGKKNRQNAKM